MKARTTSHRHREPVDTPKPTTGHSTAFQRDEIHLHHPEHRHNLCQPGKHHRSQTPSHPQEQTPQPRATILRIKKNFFFSYKSHCSFPQHIVGDMNQLLSCSVQFSCSVVSNSLRPHEFQHTRPPCPSPTPRVHPNSCSLSR